MSTQGRICHLYPGSHMCAASLECSSEFPTCISNCPFHAPPGVFWAPKFTFSEMKSWCLLSPTCFFPGVPISKPMPLLCICRVILNVFHFLATKSNHLPSFFRISPNPRIRLPLPLAWNSQNCFLKGLLTFPWVSNCILHTAFSNCSQNDHLKVPIQPYHPTFKT